MAIVYRWVAKFMIGPPGQCQNEEMKSKYFSTREEAMQDCLSTLDLRMARVPYLRSRCLELHVENQNGDIVQKPWDYFLK